MGFGVVLGSWVFSGICHDLTLQGYWGRGQQMLDSYSLCSPVQEPDTDLEVVLEKKGNMDEAHIDQVWPHPHLLPCVLPHPSYQATRSWSWKRPQLQRLPGQLPWPTFHVRNSAFSMSWWESLTASLAAGQLVIQSLRVRLSSLCSLHGENLKPGLGKGLASLRSILWSSPI